MESKVLNELSQAKYQKFKLVYLFIFFFKHKLANFKLKDFIFNFGSFSFWANLSLFKSYLINLFVSYVLWNQG